eukprot:Gb_39636 [translate_table: standard]
MTVSVDKSPGTPAAKIERTPSSTPGGAKVREEKIFVTVRVRPLSSRELAQRDQSAWECTNDHTILFKPASHERSHCPVSYTFDRVFGPTCPTDRVYEEGAKDVALSALTGINATIFAYGQTSSGKTFTMRGITESANPDRDFVLKISALEIYNEIVRDLLNPDTGPLRLMDDPEKGTVVERLVEETAKDSQHLRQIIAVCEAQRQVGETALNDTSSRSHQIIRLTVESTLRGTSGSVKSLLASLNFVDLAGSERASQTNAEGARLKEGCHINRSLLTLSTVIRKLRVDPSLKIEHACQTLSLVSGGKRNGHIPYRDSKLTRILQLSLGGNARTAIICTMSPAVSHVEQSRNTLSFATRAKEVTNSAQVNMVISDKQLVKQLQKEVARLEAELRTPEQTTTVCSEALLIEKELQIQKEGEGIGTTSTCRQTRDLNEIKMKTSFLFLIHYSTTSNAFATRMAWHFTTLVMKQLLSTDLPSFIPSRLMFLLLSFQPRALNGPAADPTSEEVSSASVCFCPLLIQLQSNAPLLLFPFGNVVGAFNFAFRLSQTKMETEMRELKIQRDLAQARLDELHRKLQEEQQQVKTPEIKQSESPREFARCLSYVAPLSPQQGVEMDAENKTLEKREISEETEPNTLSRPRNTLTRQTVRQSTTASLMLVQEIRKLEQLQDELGEDASRALEALQKEVVCLRLAQAGMNHDAAETIAKLQAEIKDMHALRAANAGKDGVSTENVNMKSMNTNLMEEICRLQAMGDRDKAGADSTIATLEEQLDNVQKSIDNLVLLPPSVPTDEASPSPAKSKTQSRKKKTLPLSLSSSGNRQHLVRSPCSPRSSSRRSLAFETENNPPKNNDVTTTPQGSQKSTPTKSEDGDGLSSREGTPSHRRSSSVNVRKMQNMFKTAAEENIQSIRSYVTELKERVAKLQYQKQLLVCQVLELEANENANIDEEAVEEDEAIEGNTMELNHPAPSPGARRSLFEKQQMQIIELWDLCQVSIIHRTQFYLLFKGDPADDIYMEVELRRLTWMQQHFAELGNSSPANMPDEHVVSLASSARALKRERELLAKRMRSRFTSEQREMLFAKWEIPLDGKQRKLQLAQKLWTDPYSKQHIQESADIVAKLVGFCEPGHVSKEMFELNFAPPSDQKPWLLGWNPIAKLLDL